MNSESLKGYAEFMQPLESTHYIIFLFPFIALIHLVSLVLIPILAFGRAGVWWKWFFLTLGIGIFAWIPLLVFIKQGKK